MKIVFMSDIHGVPSALEAALAKADSLGYDRLVLLGDLLYHGPRNPLPDTYAPKNVIDILESMKEQIICVRGNCDSEVDQMVLPFPILQDSAYLFIDGVALYASHGHHAAPDTLPPLPSGTVFLSGHTHIPMSVKKENGILCLNPGSVSLPKGGFPKSYMIYENRSFTVKSFDGEVILQTEI